MGTSGPLVERFAIGVDIQGYSGRKIRHQQLGQDDLIGVLDGAATAVGLGRRRWRRLPTGDGELAILPPDVDLATVVGPFVVDLNARLADYNDDHSSAARLRLRVAMHTDVLVLARGAYQFAGPALVWLSRLLDSDPVRRALVAAEAVDGAELALIVSEPVHRKVVESGLAGIRPRQFRRVAVDIPAKHFSEPPYLHVPGCDVNALDLGSPPHVEPSSPGPEPPPSPGPSPPSGRPPRSGEATSTSTVIHGSVHGKVNVIGNTYLPDLPEEDE